MIRRLQTTDKPHLQIQGWKVAQTKGSLREGAQATDKPYMKNNN